MTKPCVGHFARENNKKMLTICGALHLVTANANRRFPAAQCHIKSILLSKHGLHFLSLLHNKSQPLTFIRTSFSAFVDSKRVHINLLPAKISVCGSNGTRRTSCWLKSCRQQAALQILTPLPSLTLLNSLLALSYNQKFCQIAAIILLVISPDSCCVTSCHSAAVLVESRHFQFVVVAAIVRLSID